MAHHHHETRSKVNAEYLEVDEVITLFGNRYLREHLSDTGWEQESGMLERRHEQFLVAVERRRFTTVR